MMRPNCLKKKTSKKEMRNVGHAVHGVLFSCWLRLLVLFCCVGGVLGRPWTCTTSDLSALKHSLDAMAQC